MKVSVVIPVYKNKKIFFENLNNNFQFLKNCQVIIIDDCSGENIKKELEEKFPIIKYFENRVNLGFSKSANIGIKKAETDLILLLNSDVRLIDDSFKKAVDLFTKDDSLFAVSFLQTGENNERSGKNKIYFKNGLVYHDKSNNLKFGLTAWAEGGSSLFRRSHLSELGGFDEIYSPFYWEDIDLSFRAYKRGWNVIFDPNIKVHHKHESTIGKYYDKNFIETISIRNQLLFTWKNIDEFSKIFLSFFYLPYNILSSLLKGRTNFLKAFFLAILKSKGIFFKRKKTVNELSDEAIFLFFK